MKTLLLTLSLIIISPNLFSQSITIGYPVDAITLNQPKNNSKTELNASFIWNYDSNADSYQIELQDYMGFDTVLDTSIIDTSLKFPPEILGFDKLNRWRVRGVNETLGYGEWSVPVQANHSIVYRN